MATRRAALAGLMIGGGLTASGAAWAQGAAVALPGLAAHDLAPRAGGPPWRIFLRIPEGPAPAAGWPALMLLDANAVMGIATDALRVQAAYPAGTGIRQAVLVGIGYPTEAAYDSVRRSWDYSPPPGRGYPPHTPGGPEVRTGGADAFLAFSRTPADVCVVEVGMGGRFDATNVLEPEVLAACGIAALGLDHERFLLAPEEGTPLEPMARIAFEKAGIAKRGVTLVSFGHTALERGSITAQAERAGTAPLFEGDAWHFTARDDRLAYADGMGTLDLPAPALPGAHQAANASLAIAMLRHQSRIAVSEEAIATGLAHAQWPARMQRLQPGPLTGSREVWLDGGHNPQAGAMLGAHFAGQRLHLVIGMIEGKDPAALTGPLAPALASITAVPVPGHDWHPPQAFGPAARAAPDLTAAMAMIPADGLPVLIAGSLYLAGEVLRLNDEAPD